MELGLERLEDRRLLSTTIAYSTPLLGTVAHITTGAGLTYKAPGVNAGWVHTSGTGLSMVSAGPGNDPYDPNGYDYGYPVSAATLTLSGLPTHSMIRIKAYIGATPSQTPGDTDEVKFEAGPYQASVTKFLSGTLDESGGYTPGGETTGRLNSWIANSSPTIQVTVSDKQGEGDDGLWLVGLSVEVYTPTVTVGSPTLSPFSSGVSESDETNHPFYVGRDIPAGYSPTGSDDAVPEVVISLKAPTGSASEGTDYNSISRSVTIPSSKTNHSSSVDFKVKQDSKPEGYGADFKESVFLEIDPNSTNYVTNPANAGWVDILEDTHQLTASQILSDASVQAAITTAWANSNPNGALVDKVEQGFSVWYSQITGELSVQITPRGQNTPNDQLPPPPANPDPAKIMVAVLHTHPFTVSDGYLVQGWNANDITVASNRSAVEWIYDHSGLVVNPQGETYVEVIG